MTRFQALFVKYLRIKEDGTWRYVCKKYIERYPFSFYGKYIGGNQLVGMDLCNEAMNVLNEKIEDGWN